jgi:hypothetical protein
VNADMGKWISGAIEAGINAADSFGECGGKFFANLIAISLDIHPEICFAWHVNYNSVNRNFSGGIPVDPSVVIGSEVNAATLMDLLMSVQTYVCNLICSFLQAFGFMLAAENIPANPNSNSQDVIASGQIGFDPNSQDVDESSPDSAIDLEGDADSSSDADNFPQEFGDYLVSPAANPRFLENPENRVKTFEMLGKTDLQSICKEYNINLLDADKLCENLASKMGWLVGGSLTDEEIPSFVNALPFFYDGNGSHALYSILGNIVLKDKLVAQICANPLALNGFLNLIFNLLDTSSNTNDALSLLFSSHKTPDGTHRSLLTHIFSLLKERNDTESMNEVFEKFGKGSSIARNTFMCHLFVRDCDLNKVATDHVTFIEILLSYCDNERQYIEVMENLLGGCLSNSFMEPERIINFLFECGMADRLLKNANETVRRAFSKKVAPNLLEIFVTPNPSFERTRRLTSVANKMKNNYVFMNTLRQGATDEEVKLSQVIETFANG